MSTGISWTDETWNPTVGCSRVSPGCENCYAEKVAHRGMSPQHKGLTVLGKQGVRWNGKINLVPHKLEEPLRWTRPRRVFVDSMSDLFHPGVPFEYVARVYAVMQLAQHHTFQVLTKRIDRALEFYKWLDTSEGKAAWMKAVVGAPDGKRESWSTKWPFRNIWLGVSVEDQQRADERIPLLLECPAAVRFLSCEPLLDDICLDKYLACPSCGYTPADKRLHADHRLCNLPDSPEIHWVIAGGESGPGARMCDVQWLASIELECRNAEIPFFMKQLGSRTNCSPQTSKKGDDPSEWPPRLRVQQFPDPPPTQGEQDG